jgi:anti-sigma factor RsiW
LRDWLSAYVDGEVSAAQREWLELHLERCSTCQGLVGDYRQVRRLLAMLPGDSWTPPVAPTVARASARGRGWGLAVAGSPSVALALVLGLVAGAAGTMALHSGGLFLARGAAPAVHVRSAARPAPSAAAASAPGADVGAQMARAVAAEALPASRSLPEEDRGAIVVLVYIGGSRRPAPDRRMTIYQVDNPVATWSALQQAVLEQPGERLPTGAAPAAPLPAVAAWPRAPQWWKVRVV